MKYTFPGLMGILNVSQMINLISYYNGLGGSNFGSGIPLAISIGKGSIINSTVP